MKIQLDDDIEIISLDHSLIEDHFDEVLFPALLQESNDQQGKPDPLILLHLSISVSQLR